MSTKLHSFIDIFEYEFDSDKGPIKINKISIPLIQRDYAQGRLDDDIKRIRTRFLNALYKAITSEPLVLDFIYGDIDKNGIMTPLDGQQRLTTLFLLHWYAAKKSNIPPEKYSFLNKFSYETRYSARYFCSELIIFTPSFTKKLSEEIINQSWFPLEWKKDPTISSMLVMLDDIDQLFKGLPNIWERLENKAICFYFLPIRDMGLTDELYIKMNSRGKPLTMFEHFKAELERKMRETDKNNMTDNASRIMSKIDRTWTDLLWQYSNDDKYDNIIDDAFIRYFRFICDIICYRNGKSPQIYSSDIFDLLNRYFSPDNETTLLNIKTLEAFFDCWCNITGYSTPAEFLSSFMSSTHQKDKIVVDLSRYKIDIFEDYLHHYSDRSNNNRLFPLNRFILLYAITIYLQNQNIVTYEQFVRRIRIINNLIQNSENEVSDRADKNRIPAILQTVDAIVLTGDFNEEIDNNFNVNQIKEEKEKIEYLLHNPNNAETLFELEDHKMLNGQISIIGLKNLDYANRFASLFKCNLDKIDCALMTFGNYGQKERKFWRFQYGSSCLSFAWHELFHKSSNMGFDNTKDILIKLLASNTIFSNDILSNIIDSYIAKCEQNNEYPWNYYYVKYPSFRPGSYGKLSNSNADTKPYLFSVMQTKNNWSQNTYIPYLKEADNKHLSRDHMGQRLIYSNVHIICENDAYIVRKNEDDCIVDKVQINQNAHGIDIEDRIVKLKNYIQSM